MSSRIFIVSMIPISVRGMSKSQFPPSRERIFLAGRVRLDPLESTASRFVPVAIAWVEQLRPQAGGARTTLLGAVRPAC